MSATTIDLLTARIDKLQATNNDLRNKLESGGWSKHVEKWMETQSHTENTNSTSDCNNNNNNSNDEGVHKQLEIMSTSLKAEASKNQELRAQIGELLSSTIPKLEADLLQEKASHEHDMKLLVGLRKDNSQLVERLQSVESQISDRQRQHEEQLAEMKLRTAEAETTAAHATSAAQEAVTRSERDTQKCHELEKTLLDARTQWEQQLEDEREKYVAMIQSLNAQTMARDLSSAKEEIVRLTAELSAAQSALEESKDELTRRSTTNSSDTPVAAALARSASLPTVLPTLQQDVHRNGLVASEMVQFWFEGHEAIRKLTREKSELQRSCEESQKASAELSRRVEKIDRTRAAFLDTHNPTKFKQLEDDVETLHALVQQKDEEILRLGQEIELLRLETGAGQDAIATTTTTSRARIEAAANEISEKRREVIAVQKEIGLLESKKASLDEQLGNRHKRLREMHNAAITCCGASSLFPDLLWTDENESDDDSNDPAPKRLKQGLIAALQSVEQAGATTSDLNEQLHSLQLKNQTLIAELTAAQSKLEMANDAAEKKLSTMENAVNKYRNHCREMLEQLKSKVTENSTLKDEIATLGNALKQSSALLEATKKGFVELSGANAELVSRVGRLEYDIGTHTELKDVQESISVVQAALHSQEVLMQRAVQLRQVEADMSATSTTSTSVLLEENERLRGVAKEVGVKLEKAELLTKEAAQEAEAARAERDDVARRLADLEKCFATSSVAMALQSDSRALEVLRTTMATSMKSSATSVDPSSSQPLELPEKHVAGIESVREQLEALVKVVSEAKGPVPSPQLPPMPVPAFLQAFGK